MRHVGHAGTRVALQTSAPRRFNKEGALGRKMTCNECHVRKQSPDYNPLMDKVGPAAAKTIKKMRVIPKLTPELLVDREKVTKPTPPLPCAPYIERALATAPGPLLTTAPYLRDSLQCTKLSPSCGSRARGMRGRTYASSLVNTPSGVRRCYLKWRRSECPPIHLQAPAGLSYQWESPFLLPSLAFPLPKRSLQRFSRQA